jgi:site-specific DNA-methyltransferase (cytosine-N4-specific)
LTTQPRLWHNQPNMKVGSLLFSEKPEGSEIIVGDALTVLKDLDSNLCRCCITSPPYWGLRDYGVPVQKQIGAELKLEEYINNLVEIFNEVYRVLTPDGTLWLNIGDSYTSGNRTWRDSDKKNPARYMKYRPPTPEGLKPKDLIGVPWRVAFAIQMSGWYLRSDIIWSNPNTVHLTIILWYPGTTQHRRTADGTDTCRTPQREPDH